MSTIFHERARVGALSRSRPDDDPELQAARQNLSDLMFDRQVREIAAAWPQLSEQKRQRIIALLTAGASA